jgi:hypothetical protein
MPRRTQETSRRSESRDKASNVVNNQYVKNPSTGRPAMAGLELLVKAIAWIGG